jgi:uncharacterized alpha-E superfamily protein
MLSRVADSLYWMSRYFERAGHCARVLQATHNLMLDPAKITADERWLRALAFIGFPKIHEELDPEMAIIRLAMDPGNRSSIVACISGARDNASQVREEISSEMWEHLNRLYHDVTQPVWKMPVGEDAASFRGDDEAEAMRRASEVREGTYKFHGITDLTMNHDEGWHFIQLGKATEHACSVSILLDAYFSTSAPATDLDWLCLLTSCGAFEAFCRAYTADLKPANIAELLLLHPEFPFSVRYSAEQMYEASQALTANFSAPGTSTIERIIGRLRSSVSFVEVEEVTGGDPHKYLNNIIEQCTKLHAAVNDIYIEYPIEAVFEI